MRLECICRDTFASRRPKVSVFKHLEVNVFPSVPYTLSINIRRDEAAALQQYFKLEVNDWPRAVLQCMTFSSFVRYRDPCASPGSCPLGGDLSTLYVQAALYLSQSVLSRFPFFDLTNLPITRQHTTNRSKRTSHGRRGGGYSLFPQEKHPPTRPAATAAEAAGAARGAGTHPPTRTPRHVLVPVLVLVFAREVCPSARRPKSIALFYWGGAAWGQYRRTPRRGRRQRQRLRGWNLPKRYHG